MIHFLVNNEYLQKDTIAGLIFIMSGKWTLRKMRLTHSFTKKRIKKLLFTDTQTKKNRHYEKEMAIRMQ